VASSSSGSTQPHAHSFGVAHFRRGGIPSKGSKQGFITENIEDHGDHGAVSILCASRGRVIEHRAKRYYLLLRGPPMFSVLKTYLFCRSTEAERAITKHEIRGPGPSIT
jgi:hypothetical protein